ncbi:MAG: Murein DD-endopeptidase MepM and murein hydrolase activator NlpD, containing LysM domain [Pelagibacterales bacterium]|nr:Murein DD-endopeptidase MepM and murein hydrolase activator NlpD, containing LysM domain [Pelagibacterales bacterium]
MALNQIYGRFSKIFISTKNIFFLPIRSGGNYFFYFFLIILVFVVFIIISNLLGKKNKIEQQNLNSVIQSKEFSNLSDFFVSKLNSPYREIKYLIQNNDNIEKILKIFNINSKDIKNISNKLKVKKLTNIYPGRKLSLILKKLENGSNTVINLTYPINKTSSIEIRKSKNDFLLKENLLQLYKKEVVIKGEINNNLYSAAVEAGIEPNIIIEFARIYGFEVDFQRDIRKGDWFEILYERFEDDNEVVKDTGKIIYASMYVNGEEINLYNFRFKNETGYYDLKGKSIVKSLMKTPINGARLSSSFGMRKHPIKGYNKMHKGTDFAAPSGTPIMASGSGTITRARWCGGGGNCIKIKHNSTYETIYAHMKNYARGIKEGKKVKQGQVIGYVGSTGLSTGPHLHYEVIVNGKKVNSQTLKLPSGKILKGDSRKEFEVKRIKIDIKLSELR